MNTSEILTMTNPKGCDPSDVGSGGLPDLTPEMVMQGCVGLHRKYTYAALVKICGDASGKTTDGLLECLLMDMIDKALKEHWNYEKYDLKELAKIAICELHSPKQFDTDEKRGIALSIGTGRIIIGVDYRRHYKRYYECVYSQIEDYTNVAVSHLSRTLGD